MALGSAAITGNIRDFTTGWHNAPINVTRTTVNPIPGEETTLAPNFTATFYTDENGDVAFTLPFDTETPSNYELTLPKGGTYATTITGDTTIADWIQSAIQPPLPTGIFVPVQSLGTAIVRADGGIGGDARGDNAVDLQRSRVSDSQVASGDEAVIAGGLNNIASGGRSVIAGGLNNTASNLYATVSGGRDNIAGGGEFFATVCGGFGNTATGEESIVLGGRDNIAAGTLSLAAGKNMQLASSASRTMILGQSGVPVAFTQPDAFITYGLRAFMSAPNTAVTDGDMKDGSISFWIDEVSGLLVFRVKYADGTLQTGEVPFSKSAIIETISTGREWTAADNGKIFHFPNSITMNSPDGLPDGWQVSLKNLSSANTITFTATTTINGEDDLTTMTAVNFAAAFLYHEAANVHYINGDLA